MKYVILILLISNIMWSQNLDKHRWENRVIVITSDQAHSKLAESQFDLLKKENDKLIDRKLVIYKCIVDSCIFFDGKHESKISQTNNNSKGFNVRLMGLDGGEKFNSTKVESASVFFNLIDKMPMRRQELKNRD